MLELERHWNQGVARAIVLGYEWVISFDQDSWIHSDLVTVLIEIYHLQRNTEMIGIIGCNFEDENTRTVSLKILLAAPFIVKSKR